ncbi:hypothetical protein TNIN_125481 [Trichonephila inaurata madagascariensis]|uniref:Uncharacterized protein n=1 Tax=Trichonephila inaurata madagascariensis TaxID=2747483 RepID=A0A8X7CBM8_9ARAC|nr:hypothetical protein TNIN_125481 [Trichonephila inaurata madagascariensis]
MLPLSFPRVLNLNSVFQQDWISGFSSSSAEVLDFLLEELSGCLLNKRTSASSFRRSSNRHRQSQRPPSTLLAEVAPSSSTDHHRYDPVEVSRV